MKLTKVSLALASVSCWWPPHAAATTTTTPLSRTRPAGASHGGGATLTQAQNRRPPRRRRPPPRPRRPTPPRPTSRSRWRAAVATSRASCCPKCTGIAVFDQANEGAMEAAGELGTEAEFVGPPLVTDSHRTDRVRHQRRHPGRRRDHDLQQRRRPGRTRRAGGGRCRDTVVAWDSPIPSGAGREPVRRPGRLRRNRTGDG